MSELSLFFLCAGKAKPSRVVSGVLMSGTEEKELSRSMVKTHVLSLQSRGRSRATCTMGRGHLARVTGLHAADRSGTREQCTGVDGWDAPRRGDGSSQRAGRGYSAGYASTDISPNLCPGLPFIRSTRGSSYTDGYLPHAYTLKHLFRSQ